MRKNQLFKLSLLLLLFSSCSSYRDKTYFQNLDRSKDLTQPINNYSPITIQVGDILGVSVHSLSPEGDAPFNGGAAVSTAASAGTAAVGAPTNNGASYTVDQKGEIHLPQIAPIKVAGLTIAEAQVAIHNNLTNVLKEPVVNAHIVNFKISVIGDVGHPGVFAVNGERITLLEALSNAGDLTITAKRQIFLIREIDGERKVINIDLTSSNILSSPYYYLKNNDVIVVDAGKEKFAQTSSFNRTFPIILSMLSFLIGIVGIIVYSKK